MTMAAEVDEMKPKGPLFEGIRFVVIPTKDFSDEKAREVMRLLPKPQQRQVEVLKLKV